MKETISVQAVCSACDGTGVYVGMAERDGVAVVCIRCKGTGEITVSYSPFRGRRPLPATVTSVHVARGYVLAQHHAQCDGGLPASDWSPGTPIPADEKLYCPYTYTHQDWCARPEHPEDNHNCAPILAGRYIFDCPFWNEKAECWKRFHADPNAPKQAN